MTDHPVGRSPVTASPELWRQPAAGIDARVADLMARMTVR